METYFKTTRIRILYSVILSSFMIVAILLASAVNAQEVSSPERTVVHQDESAALAQHIAILARETGLPLERVESAIMFQQAFSAYTGELFTRYADQISVVWTEPVPGTTGYIQFVDAIPPTVGTWEFRSPGNVVLLEGGMITLADHKRRAELTAVALADLGYQNAITFFDPFDQVIQIELQIPEGVAPPSTSELVGAVQNRVHADTNESGEPQMRDRAAIVQAHDLELTILTGSGPIINLQSSRGGNWLLDDGIRECTSGWSVSGPFGDGIITAGHCYGLNQFEAPGIAPYDMDFRDQEYGLGGDVEYHTTEREELAEFYADEISIRNVTDIQVTNEMPGKSVCFYGRASNNRTCNHTVEAIGCTVLSGGTIEVGNLARASNDSGIQGDSGGGWSISTKAWGVYHGEDADNKSYFTPIQEVQNAHGVTIKTK